MDKCSVTSVAIIQDLKQDALKFLIYKKADTLTGLSVYLLVCIYSIDFLTSLNSGALVKATMTVSA